MVADVLLKIFGLESASGTLVGSEFVNGVSGGERKRVSLAEVVSKISWIKDSVLTTNAETDT
jgi:ABC-type multidrug transport system ATPase subunit